VCGPDRCARWHDAHLKRKGPLQFHDGSPLTSEDVKASYERIINPPPGVVSIRRSYYTDLTVDDRPSYGDLQAAQPDGRRAGGAGLALHCIYSAAKLKENPRYPETEIMGSGPFTFLAHVRR